MVRLGKLDLFVIDQLLADPLQGLLGLDHVDEESSLKESVVVCNVLIELLITTSNSGHDVLASILNN